MEGGCRGQHNYDTSFVGEGNMSKEHVAHASAPVGRTVLYKIDAGRGLPRLVGSPQRRWIPATLDTNVSAERIQRCRRMKMLEDRNDGQQPGCWMTAKPKDDNARR